MASSYTVGPQLDLPKKVIDNKLRGASTANPAVSCPSDANFDLSQKWLRHLRETTKTTVALPCHFCRDIKDLPSEEALVAHILDAHPEIVPRKEERDAYEKFWEAVKVQPSVPPIKTRRSHNHTSRNQCPEKPRNNLEDLTADKLLDLGALFTQQDRSSPQKSDTWGPNKSNKKRVIGHGPSPSSSIRTTYSNESRRAPVKGASPKHIFSPKPQFTSLGRSRDVDEIVRPPATGKRLFEPDSDSPFAAQTLLLSNTSQRPRSSPQQQHKKSHKSGQFGDQLNPQRPLSGGEPGLFSASVLANKPTIQQDNSFQEPPKIVRQPETRPISQEQLVAEVKGIYAGLVMVEGKCIQVDAKQAVLAREAPPGTQPKLNNEQWQALIALHRTLLHEHHDFFLASQHPSATPAVRRLAIKYAMPARLWRHGIHSFLELLRNRLPDSLDHMLAFIYLAYSMMTLLYETVPAFEETWIECLGDLGRYRMAIEDDDIRDREVWTQVSRQWYLKASDRAPRVGRLYHHLAILARPNALQQLFFYGKALSISQPFPAVKDSVLTLFEPVLSGKQTRRLPPVITVFIKIHAFLFMRNNTQSFRESLEEFINLTDSHISRVTQSFLEQGYYISISNCLALLSYKSPDRALSKALSTAGELASQNVTQTVKLEVPVNPLPFKETFQLSVQTLDINCKRIGNQNVLSFLHVTFIFLLHVSRFPAAMRLLEGDILWDSLISMLNSFVRFYHLYPRIEGDNFPIPEKNDFRPMPEEFAMRGLDCSASYPRAGWFQNKNIEEEDQYKEDASMNTDYRPERILWLGYQLAKTGKWFGYKDIRHKFVRLGLVTDSFSDYIGKLYYLSCRIISRSPSLTTFFLLTVQAKPVLAAESGTALSEFGQLVRLIKEFEVSPFGDLGFGIILAVSGRLFSRHARRSKSELLTLAKISGASSILLMFATAKEGLTPSQSVMLWAFSAFFILKFGEKNGEGVTSPRIYSIALFMTTLTFYALVVARYAPLEPTLETLRFAAISLVPCAFASILLCGGIARGMSWQLPSEGNDDYQEIPAAERGMAQSFSGTPSITQLPVQPLPLPEASD